MSPTDDTEFRNGAVPIIEARGVTRSFRLAGETVTAVKELDFDVPPGRFTNPC